MGKKKKKVKEEEFSGDEDGKSRGKRPKQDNVEEPSVKTDVLRILSHV